MPKYFHRIIEAELKKALKEFPVVALTGPRQTGKSTLLQNIFKDYFYTTFDDPLTRKTASDDPKTFLSQSPKMIIDEIQYLPEILPYIKLAVDSSRATNGHYILTGSQFFPLMVGITESLAGRIALYELLGFSYEEMPKLISIVPKTCFTKIFNGFYPAVVAHNVDPKRFYSSYVQTYIERDIRQIISIQELKTFQNFIELLAARIASLLNLHEIAKECGISFTTAKRWLSLLETSRIIYLLRPYTKNITKRIVKSPKLYFIDTGLLTYLLRYPDADTLLSGPQNGAIFENMIISELLKYKFNHQSNYELYFYRDTNQNEIDVILDYGQSTKLLEIKLTATPREQHFDVLKEMLHLFKEPQGFLVSFNRQTLALASNVTIIPWTKLFELL
ncbi:MAG: ATP-binding protein [Gammaproteobacteria bacterium]|nr:ATP-binding protein [Gammaproteobacteria bacterium]